MSRSGIEAKPAWRSVPRGVRERAQAMVGAAVARGTRVWGGYGPTPTFRLKLTDGRGIFFKGANHTSNEFARGALAREERVYRELSGLIGSWAPRFYGAFRHDDWHVLLLEDAGAQTVPPWTPATTRRIAHAYAAFHASTWDKELPAWLPRPGDSLARVTWSRVADESDGLRSVAALASGHAEDANTWLRASLPLFSRLGDAAATLPGPYALLHGDTRSDNLRFTRGRLYLFDWPSIEVGRPELDVAAFAQSITVEGGGAPEQFVAQYGEVQYGEVQYGEVQYGERLALDPDALDAMVAWIAAFFADLAWRPDIPGLPRLRRFQRQQLGVVLAWAARRLRLPEPTWVSAMQ